MFFSCSASRKWFALNIEGENAPPSLLDGGVVALLFGLQQNICRALPLVCVLGACLLCSVATACFNVRSSAIGNGIVFVVDDEKSSWK